MRRSTARGVAPTRSPARRIAQMSRYQSGGSFLRSRIAATTCRESSRENARAAATSSPQSGCPSSGTRTASAASTTTTRSAAAAPARADVGGASDTKEGA